MISLGIDIGGTGCKCVAFRDTGEQIAMSYREYPTKPGEVNLNALALPSPPSASPSFPLTAAVSR